MADVTDDALEYVSVGSDRYRAHLITEACRAEGLKVELLTGDDSGIDPFMALIQNHRLLVRSADAARVREIVAGS